MNQRDLEKRYRGLHYEVGQLPERLNRSSWFWNLPCRFRRLLLNVCSPSSVSGVRRLRSLPADPNTASLQPYLDTKSLFVHIPKTAGISVGVSLYGRKTGDHRTIADYALCFTQAEFQSLFKFAFVRNPWDRLFSAYTYLKQGGRNQQDQDWAVKNLSAYDNFDQFVTGWVKQEHLRSGLHFRPQHEFLRIKNQPLAVDFIGHFETIATDYEHIRKKLGTGEPLAVMNKTAKKTASYRESYTEKTRQIVADVYREDIQLFGYDFSGTFKSPT